MYVPLHLQCLRKYIIYPKTSKFNNMAQGSSNTFLNMDFFPMAVPLCPTPNPINRHETVRPILSEYLIDSECCCELNEVLISCWGPWPFHETLLPPLTLQNSSLSSRLSVFGREQTEYWAVTLSVSWS